MIIPSHFCVCTCQFVDIYKATFRILGTVKVCGHLIPRIYINRFPPTQTHMIFLKHYIKMCKLEHHFKAFPTVQKSVSRTDGLFSCKRVSFKISASSTDRLLHINSWRLVRKDVSVISGRKQSYKALATQCTITG